MIEHTASSSLTLLLPKLLWTLPTLELIVRNKPTTVIINKYKLQVFLMYVFNKLLNSSASIIDVQFVRKVPSLCNFYRPHGCIYVKVVFYSYVLLKTKLTRNFCLNLVIPAIVSGREQRRRAIGSHPPTNRLATTKRAPAAPELGYLPHPDDTTSSSGIDGAMRRQAPVRRCAPLNFCFGRSFYLSIHTHNFNKEQIMAQEPPSAAAGARKTFRIKTF